MCAGCFFGYTINTARTECSDPNVDFTHTLGAFTNRHSGYQPTTTYEFKQVRCLSTTGNAAPYMTAAKGGPVLRVGDTYADKMAESCKVHGMKPLCDSGSWCVNYVVPGIGYTVEQSDAIFLGQVHQFAYPPHRFAYAFWPPGWPAIARNFDGLCDFVANRVNKGMALCNIPINSMSWNTPFKVYAGVTANDPGFMCARDVTLGRFKTNPTRAVLAARATTDDVSRQEHANVLLDLDQILASGHALSARSLWPLGTWDLSSGLRIDSTLWLFTHYTRVLLDTRPER